MYDTSVLSYFSEASYTSNNAPESRSFLNS